MPDKIKEKVTEIKSFIEIIKKRLQTPSNEELTGNK